MNRTSLAILFMCFTRLLCAQQPHEQTNAGTDFWVTDVVAGYNAQFSESIFEQSMYAPDGYADTAIVLVVGNSYCMGFAENPRTGWHRDFTVFPGHITEVRVPEDQIMCYVTHDIQPKGIHIHTECEIFAYLVTRKTFEYGNFFANTPQKFQLPPLQTGLTDASLPVALGIYTTENPCCNNTESFVPHNGVLGDFLSSSYLIVAHENNTEVFVSGHFESVRPLYSNTSNDIVWVPDAEYNLQQGEVLVIPMLCTEQGMNCMMTNPEEVMVDIHTNCKKVSIFQHRTMNTTWYFPLPLESVAPFHPDLLGNDFLVLDGAGYSYTGELSSVFHHGDTEDAPLFSHQAAIESDLLCYCPFFSFSVNYNPVCEGTPRFIYNNHPLFPTEIVLFPASYWYDNHETVCFMAPVTQMPYADKQVKMAIFPVASSDSVSHVSLSITTSLQGRFTTYVNGQLLPDSVFVIDDPLVGRYYITEVIYHENIPEVLTVENQNGFAAYLQEYRPCNSVNTLQQQVTVTMTNSGCTYNLQPVLPNIGTGVTTFCANDTLRVYADGNNDNYPITWIVDDSTFTLFTPDTLLFPLLDADTLHFIMIVEKYCPDTLMDTLYVVLHPHLTLPTDTIICRGASVTAQSDMFGFYHWSDGTEGATLTPQEEGDYTVRIDNACGSDSATIHIRFYDTLHVDFGNDTLLCELATLLLDATQQHPASYLWQDASTNTTYTVINDGRYWVVVTDGCAGVSDTIDIAYLYDLQVDLGNDTTICSNRPYTLDATTPYSHYLWHDGTTAPTHEVTTSGTYSVHVYNVCTEAYASVTIEVEDCEEAVHVPNAFTPNGDGQNDLFLPVFNHPERLESYSLQVYDRWGRLLFSTENPQQGWNCSECPVGVYVWRLEYKAASEGSKILTGSVTVVR